MEEKVLIQAQTELIRNMTVGDPILTHLQTTGVIDIFDKEKIQAKETNHERVVLLLDHVMRNASGRYCDLLSALDATNQSHVVTLLTDKLTKLKLTEKPRESDVSTLEVDHNRNLQGVTKTSKTSRGDLQLKQPDHAANKHQVKEILPPKIAPLQAQKPVKPVKVVPPKKQRPQPIGNGSTSGETGEQKAQDHHEMREKCINNHINSVESKLQELMSISTTFIAHLRKYDFVEIIQKLKLPIHTNSDQVAILLDHVRRDPTKRLRGLLVSLKATQQERVVDEFDTMKIRTCLGYLSTGEKLRHLIED